MIITVTCVVDMVRYSKVIELEQIPIVGDTITVWDRVFKNKSKKSSNVGITLPVLSRNWDNRDGGITLMCGVTSDSIRTLVAVGFK